MTANGWHRKRTTANDIERNRVYASPEHRRLRKQLALEVAAGRAHCWRCGKHLPPGSPWQLGHDDHDRDVYRGIECPPCNRKAGASKGARIRNAQAKATRLRW